MTQRNALLLHSALALGLSGLAAAQDLVVTRVAGAPAAGDPTVLLRQTQQDGGGNTRFRFYPADAPERTGPPTRWNDNAGAWRYSLRDRDLGQSFTVPAGLGQQHSLKAVTLRVGPTAQANEGGAGGAAVSMQIFEVTGTPVVDFNGTTGSQRARWDTFAPDKAFTDDFITGLVFTSLGVYTGGVLPADITTGNYMRWELTKPIPLEPGKQYAFMVMFDEPADNRGLALANDNRATTGNLGPDDGAWSFRRCGSSDNFDDVFVFDLNDAEEVETARASSSLPADMATRAAISPSTIGYPDVDTYRDFVYFIHTVTEGDPDPDPDPPPAPEEPTTGISTSIFAPVPPPEGFERQGARDGGSTSVRWRVPGNDTDLGAIFRTGPTTRQLRSITLQVSPADLGASVPGMPVVLDFMKVGGEDINSPTQFTPLFRFTGNLPDDLVGNDYITFHLLDQQQVLEKDAIYAFLFGANVEDQDGASGRIRFYTQNSNTVADTYEIRREYEFGSTRPALSDAPNILNTGREMYFYILADDIEPTVTSTAFDGSEFSLSVPSLNGGIYELYRSPDLQDPWEFLGSLPGDGSVLDFNDLPPSEDPRNFYRIQVGP